eukprot:s4552_g5.t1
MLSTHEDAVRRESNCLIIYKHDALDEYRVWRTQVGYLLCANEVPLSRACGIWSLRCRCWYQKPVDSDLLEITDMSGEKDLMCHIWHLQLIFDKRQQLGPQADKWSHQQFVEYVCRSMQDDDVKASMLEGMYKAMPESQKGYVNLEQPNANERDLTQPEDEDSQRIQMMKKAMFEVQARALKKYLKKRDGGLDTSESEAEAKETDDDKKLDFGIGQKISAKTMPPPPSPRTPRTAKAVGEAKTKKTKVWRKKGEETSESEPEPAASSSSRPSKPASASARQTAKSKSTNKAPPEKRQTSQRAKDLFKDAEAARNVYKRWTQEFANIQWFAHPGTKFPCTNNGQECECEDAMFWCHKCGSGYCLQCRYDGLSCSHQIAHYSVDTDSAFLPDSISSAESCFNLKELFDNVNAESRYFGYDAGEQAAYRKDTIDDLYSRARAGDKAGAYIRAMSGDRNVTNADCMILISLSYGKQSQVSLSRTASHKAAADGVVGSGYSDEVMLQDVERVKYLQNIDLGLKDSDQAAHSPLIAIAKLYCQRNLRVRTEQSENRRRGRRGERQPRYRQQQQDEEEEIEVEETEEENEPVGRLRSTTPSSGARLHGREEPGRYENVNRRIPVTPPKTPPAPPPRRRERYLPLSTSIANQKLGDSVTRPGPLPFLCRLLEKEHHVPGWDGQAKGWRRYTREVCWYVRATPQNKRRHCASKLMSRLTGPARLLAMSWPDVDFDKVGGTKECLRRLAVSPLVRQSLLNAAAICHQYFSNKRAPGEPIHAFLVREALGYSEFVEAIIRLYEDKHGIKQDDKDFGLPSDELDEKWTQEEWDDWWRTSSSADSFVLGVLRGFRVLQAAGLSPEDKRDILGTTRGSLEFEVVTHALQTLWDEQFLGRQHGRGQQHDNYQAEHYDEWWMDGMTASREDWEWYGDDWDWWNYDGYYTSLPEEPAEEEAPPSPEDEAALKEAQQAERVAESLAAEAQRTWSEAQKGK